MTTIQNICEAFNQITGHRINLSQGAIKLYLADNAFWLEVDTSGQFLCVHTRIGALLAQKADYWLAINSQIFRLRGAWFAFHQPSNSIRLCWTYPIAQMSGQMLVNALSHLNQIEQDISLENMQEQSAAKAISVQFIQV
jgi:hypothetical protein